MGWRDFQVSTPVEKIENIEKRVIEGALFDKFDKFDKDGEVKTERPIEKMALSEFEKAGKVLKVWSEVLKEDVYFISSEAVINRNPLDAVAYTAQELQAMLDMTPEEVKAAHAVKRAFHKARIINHTKEVSNGSRI